MEEWKTVWILGSGFSKPLGGPMLPELLSHAAFEDAAVRYPDVFKHVRSETNAVRYLYHYGTRFNEGPIKGYEGHRGQRLWAHAEEFLDQIDAAAREPQGPNARRLLQIVNSRAAEAPEVGSISDLRSAALRVVAIQCTTFALDLSLQSERWLPYKGWLDDLNNDDTIITFNYDPVLEKLNKEYGRLHFMVPGVDLRPSGPETRFVDVYKLHGSVTWRREPKKIVKIVSQDHDLEFGAKCDPSQLGIATPGASKHEDIQKLFMPLWTMAESALEQANAVVFIGYRFPPSDAFSRGRLLQALWKNRRTDLVHYIVLGPNENHEDVVRLRRMLEWTWRSSPISESRQLATPITIPMFGEDFLTVWRFDQQTRAMRAKPGDKV